MSPKLFWIPGPWRGKLAVSTRPRGGDWLYDEIAALRNVGVDVLASLLETTEVTEFDLFDECHAAEASGIQFQSFPIPDRGTPASTLLAVALIASITESLERGENVAIHCRQGVGRSGLIAVAVLVVSGKAPDDAMRIVSAARGEDVPETTIQREWLRRLPSLTVLQNSLLA